MDNATHTLSNRMFKHVFCVIVLVLKHVVSSLFFNRSFGLLRQSSVFDVSNLVSQQRFSDEIVNLSTVMSW